METERYNLLNPDEKNKASYVEQCLGQSNSPVLAASDYMRSHSEQIRPFVKNSFYSLGTDGFGRSDTRKNLRKFFEVDKEHIVTYALSVLSNEQSEGQDPDWTIRYSVSAGLKACAQQVGKKSKMAWDQFQCTLEQMEDPSLSQSIPGMIRHVLEAGYEDYLKGEYSNYRNRLEDLQQLAHYGEGFDTPEAFLTQLALETLSLIHI